MDPLTQGLLGAVAAQAVAGKHLPRTAWIIGMSAGMFADVDVFFSTTGDSLARVVQHRHFTHSLAFIPVGGLIAALPFLLVPSLRRAWKWVILAAIVAYATHAPLDACTSYGTLLLWPFSHSRISWDCISIIDPIFTLILLVGVVWAAWIRLPQPARIMFVMAMMYLGLGVIQQQRVLLAQQHLAASRGHSIERGRALTTIGNLVLWRSLYEAGGTLHADAVRVPLLGSPTVRQGESIELLDRNQLPQRILTDQTQQRAMDQFEWFADGYVALVDHDHLVIGDMRYSLKTDGFEPMWGLLLRSPTAAKPYDMIGLNRRRGEALTKMWQELIGQGPPGIPLADLSILPGP